ncbi:MAG: hypothetical protein D8M59_07535 [Planctomycetes bacterium]|nr:hypothetical protein [Planctomycetota bacterium]NOG53179.1 hypothetical protein [Planctomycetota bacterium]
MPKPTPEPRLWKNISSALEEMESGELRGLVHDLYKLAPENRAFLAAWIGDENASAELLDGYKAKITAQFFTRGKPRLRGGCDLALCRRLIKGYRRVTTAPEMLGGFDIPGTIDLSLHYVEVGTDYVSQIGWHEAKPYDSMGKVAHELMDLCRDTSGQKWAGKFLPRIRAVAELGREFGYGFGDDLSQLQVVFEETAAAFEQRRAKRSW